MTQNDEKLLSASAIAKELGVSPAKVKKAIEDAHIEPAMVKCNRPLYPPSVLEEIKQKIISK